MRFYLKSTSAVYKYHPDSIFELPLPKGRGFLLLYTRKYTHIQIRSIKLVNPTNQRYFHKRRSDDFCHDPTRSPYGNVFLIVEILTFRKNIYVHDHIIAWSVIKGSHTYPLIRIVTR